MENVNVQRAPGDERGFDMDQTIRDRQETNGLERIVSGYEGGEEMQLGPYLGFIGVYGLALAAFLAAAQRRELPERMDFRDIVLLGVATHKLSRLVTQDWVTSPLRAPFTRYHGSSGAGEVKEAPRGKGVQKAMGDLLTCPWCTGAWVAAGFGYSLAFAPRLTRWIGGIFAIEAVSDFLQIAYGSAKKQLQ